MTVERWARLSEEAMRLGYRKVLRRRYRLPDGREADYDIKDECRVVAIFAMTDENNVVLVRQFRPGPERVLNDVPGGGVEPDEDPEAAARRELLEETGYDGEFHYVGQNYHCAYSNRIRYNYVVLHARKVQEPSLDQNEFIEVVEMPLAAFRDHVRSGSMTDVDTGYLGLDYLGLL